MEKVKELIAYAIVIVILLFLGAYIQQYNLVGKNFDTKCLLNTNEAPTLISNKK